MGDLICFWGEGGAPGTGELTDVDQEIPDGLGKPASRREVGTAVGLAANSPPRTGRPLDGSDPAPQSHECQDGDTASQ